MTSKLSTESLGRYYYHYPRLVVIVTGHSRGRDNAMTVAWHAPLSFRPPLYGIAIVPGRFTCQLILESGEFGVNFMPWEAAETLAEVGGSRGKEVDKFQKFRIAREKALKTSVPLLEKAYACYECKLIDHRPYGDHLWIAGEVVAVHCFAGAFTAEGILDLTQVTPVFYLGGDNYTTVAKDLVQHLDRGVFGKR